GWIETAGVSALLLAVPLVYTWPPLRWLPAAVTKAEPPFEAVSTLLGLPPVRRPPAPLAAGDADADALAQRGRYIATVRPCPPCHTPGPNPVRLWAPYPQVVGGVGRAWPGC